MRHVLLVMLVRMWAFRALRLGCVVRICAHAFFLPMAIGSSLGLVLMVLSVRDGSFTGRYIGKLCGWFGKE